MQRGVLTFQQTVDDRVQINFRRRIGHDKLSATGVWRSLGEMQLD